MKIKVVELETGRRPNLTKALLRALLRIASEVFFYLGFLLAFFLPTFFSIANARVELNLYLRFLLERLVPARESDERWEFHP